MQNTDKISIFYDGECPFCTRYVRYLNIKRSFGDPELVNVRNDEAAYQYLQDLALDINKGMVVRIKDRHYFGAEAVHVLAMMSTKSDWFNKLNGLIFSSRILALILYPFLALGRNSTLAILGRTQIMPEQSLQDKRSLDLYSIFAWSWALYTIFHFSYLLFYQDTITPPPNVLSFGMLLLSVLILMDPRSTRAFAALAVVQLAEIWSQMPMTSNHAIIEFFFLIAVVLAGVQSLIGRYSWAEFFRLFAPAGRWFLLIMYFFGIFHKINTDFLNPDSSCAVALWKEYPFPAFLRDGLWTHYAAIYGTFIVEGFVIIALLFKRTRYLAVIAGCAFHLFLGFCPYAFYGPFSLICFSLHLLFLPDTALEDFRKTSLYKIFMGYQFQVQLGLVLYMAALCITASHHDLAKLTGLFLLMAIPLLIFVTITSHAQENEYSRRIMKPGVIAASVALLFFLNNAAPYMGLKTHQSMNMFSNLHLEGGRSNHLILTQPPSMFHYLDDTVKVIALSTPDESDISAGYSMVYHDFLVLMSKEKTLKATYERNGQVYTDVTFEDLKVDFDKIVMPAWIRKWMHFANVDFTQPKPCFGFK